MSYADELARKKAQSAELRAGLDPSALIASVKAIDDEMKARDTARTAAAAAGLAAKNAAEDRAMKGKKDVVDLERAQGENLDATAKRDELARKTEIERNAPARELETRAIADMTADTTPEDVDARAARAHMSREALLQAGADLHDKIAQADEERASNLRMANARAVDLEGAPARREAEAKARALENEADRQATRDAGYAAAGERRSAREEAKKEREVAADAAEKARKAAADAAKAIRDEPKQLRPEVIDNLVSEKNTFDAIQQLRKDAAGINKGQIVGRLRNGIAKLVDDPKWTGFNTRMQIINKTLSKAIEGGRMTDNDQVFYSKILLDGINDEKQFSQLLDITEKYARADLEGKIKAYEESKYLIPDSLRLTPNVPLPETDKRPPEELTPEERAARVAKRKKKLGIQ